MYWKLAVLFRLHFKLILLWNLLLSAAVTYVFYLKGLDAYPLYSLAALIKLIGYAISVALEKVLFAKRIYYFHNMGLSYRRVFTGLFALDLLVLCIMLLITGIIASG